MKRNLLGVSMIGLSMVGLALVGLMGASLGPYQAVGNLPVYGPSGYSTVGQGSLTMSGGTVATPTYCLSQTTGTGSIASIPCNSLIITTTAASIYIGSSGTAQGPISGGSAAAVTLPAANVNQLYITGGSNTVVKYLWWY